DHWPHCYSLLVAGGPAGGGRVIGRSDHRGAYPADDPVAPQDVTATLLAGLGVNPRDPVHDGMGRTVPLCPGRVLPNLFGPCPARRKTPPAFGQTISRAGPRPPGTPPHFQPPPRPQPLPRHAVPFRPLEAQIDPRRADP